MEISTVALFTITNYTTHTYIDDVKTEETGIMPYRNFNHLRQ